MRGATMLGIISCILAVLSFALVGVVWSYQPVRVDYHECGTLRNPEISLETVNDSQKDPMASIMLAVVPQRCEWARREMLFSYRMALAAGTLATITAVVSFLGARHERRLSATATSRVRPGGGLDGHGLPGRTVLVVKSDDTTDTRGLALEKPDKSMDKSKPPNE